MWIQPHENLTVWSIRHDLYGPGRFTPLAHGRLWGLHHGLDPAHGHALGLSTRAQAHVHVVEKTDPTKPADCHPFGRGYFPSMGVDPPDWSDGSATPAAVPGIQSPDTPSVDSGVALSFVQGQAVPATGGLLDVMA